MGRSLKNFHFSDSDDHIGGAVLVGNGQFGEQGLTVTEVVPNIAEAEQTNPPAFSQHCAERVGTGPDHHGHVVGWVHVGDVVLGQAGVAMSLPIRLPLRKLYRCRGSRCTRRP